MFANNLLSFSCWYVCFYSFLPVCEGVSRARGSAVLVILSTILLPSKSQVAYTVFWINLFWGSFKCICSRLFSMIKNFLTVLTAYVFT